MLSFLSHLFTKFIQFVAKTSQKILVLSTLLSVLVCLVLFFVYLFKGQLTHALVSLAGMLAFLFVNLKC